MAADRGQALDVVHVAVELGHDHRLGPADLARAAADAGYADQAHLSRECRRLAGLSPSDVIRTR